MQPQLLEALGLFQWLGFALLVVAWPVYEVLKLRRRARQAEDRAAQLTQDYQHRIEALDSVQRQAFEKFLQHPQPLRTPPAGFRANPARCRGVSRDRPVRDPNRLAELGWGGRPGDRQPARRQPLLRGQHPGHGHDPLGQEYLGVPDHHDAVLSHDTGTAANLLHRRQGARRGALARAGAQLARANHP